MVKIPIDIINLICEWAAQEDIDWYPFFCPKSHNVSWKVNKYSKKFLKKGDIILHKRRNMMVYGEYYVIVYF